MPKKQLRKYLFPIIIMVLAVLPTVAQNARVAEIRKMYAEAKETIKNQEQTPSAFYCFETEVKSQYILNGSGRTDDVTHYYFLQGEFDETLGQPVYVPFFISRKFNVAAHDFYQEFLFDDKGSLVFFFQKQDTTDETRYYWGPEGLAHEAVKGERGMDEVFACRLAYDLKEAFNRLINREY